VIEAKVLTDSINTGGSVFVSVVVCRGKIRARQGILASVVLANGEVNACPDMITQSVVFCDGDVYANMVEDSIIFATGDIEVTAMIGKSVLRAGGRIDAPRQVWDSSIAAHQKNLLPVGSLFPTRQAGIEVISLAKRGVQVVEVANGKGFAQAGVRAGDHIVAVDGAPTRSVDEFRRQVRKKHVQRELLRLTIDRHGKTETITIQL
jgi:hypothetical protein